MGKIGKIRGPCSVSNFPPVPGSGTTDRPILLPILARQKLKKLDQLIEIQKGLNNKY